MPTKRINHYRQHGCLFCQKTFEDSRGLEYRQRSDDTYCHTCQRILPPEMSVEELREIRDLFEKNEPRRPQVSPTLRLASKEEFPEVALAFKSPLVRFFIRLWRKLVPF